MTPTTAEPGTDAKIAVMAERWVAERKLYHPGDADTRRGRWFNVEERPLEVCTVETLMAYVTRLRVEWPHAR